MFTAGFRRILFAILLVFTITVIGISGYVIIEGMAFLDALYMTVITVATVGFREVQPLSDAGKLFTISLIITSIGAFAYALSVITSHIVEGEIQQLLKVYQKKTHRRKMKNHIIVCGYGRYGTQATRELIAHKHPFIIIEQHKKVIVESEQDIIHFVEGDATNDEVLMKAGVTHAKALITTFPVDADNLFVVLTARSLNPNMTIISRASNDSSEKKLKFAGANKIVMPDKVGGTHMAALVVNPDVVDFLNNISIHGADETRLQEIIISEISENLNDKTINGLNIRKQSGANIVGYKTINGEFITNPLPTTKLVPGSKLFVLGTPEQIEKMKDLIYK